MPGCTSDHACGGGRCCLALRGFVGPACYCDPVTLQVVSGQGLGPGELRTVMRAATQGCGLKGALDATC